MLPLLSGFRVRVRVASKCEGKARAFASERERGCGPRLDNWGVWVNSPTSFGLLRPRSGPLRGSTRYHELMFVVITIMKLRTRCTTSIVQRCDKKNNH
jgi:hypothetical protein